jgi:hypothetical protein
MSVTWGSRLRSFLTSSKNLKTGWLITAGIVALYVGAIRPHESTEGIACSRGTGLAAVAGSEPIGLWREAKPMLQLGVSRVREADSDKAADQDAQPQVMAYLSAPPAPPAAPQEVERKTIRTSSIDLIVQKPAEAAEKIRRLAEGMGGFLVTSQISGGEDATSGSLTVRVPAVRFEEARREVRKLALRVESEGTEAQDVTRQYVDQEANLRNLRAEEAQYLTILRQARTVKDTLDVSEKLSEVRGQIEQQQAEFNALSKQIETVAISIMLRTEAEARVFGLNWRPLYSIKLAMRDGLDGLASYASSMTAFVFLLPSVVLWLATILAGAALAWRGLRWVGRRWFGWGRKAAEAPAQG